MCVTVKASACTHRCSAPRQTKSASAMKLISSHFWQVSHGFSKIVKWCNFLLPIQKLLPFLFVLFFSKDEMKKCQKSTQIVNKIFFKNSVKSKNVIFWDFLQFEFSQKKSYSTFKIVNLMSFWIFWCLFHFGCIFALTRAWCRSRTSVKVAKVQTWDNAFSLCCIMKECGWGLFLFSQY